MKRFKEIKTTRSFGIIEAVVIVLCKSKAVCNVSYESALMDLNQAIRIDDGNAISFSNRG